MWFGGCSASVLILRSRLKAIGRCSKPIRYHFLSFVIKGNMILNEFWNLQKIMIFLKIFGRKCDEGRSFVTCLIHRFEVCDVESPSK